VVEPQQLLAATAASVPQQPAASAEAGVAPAAVLPQQLPAAGGVKASDGLPANPPVVVSVDMIFSLVGGGSVDERDVHRLGAHPVPMSLRPALRGADLTTGVTELDRSTSSGQTLDELQHHPSYRPAPVRHRGYIDIHRISDA
jgi:hypothetical protein